MDVFRIRLNCIDHYQASPSSFDPKLPIDPKQNYKVPVIRIFGATETGQKVCAHVHGALPYLYVECDDAARSEPLELYIQRLRLSIDHALAISYRRDLDGTKTAFVAHISLVKGIPFYGYHVGYRPFFKIYLLNPLHSTRLADLLRQGAIMSRSFQPYESHMQYVPQWMCDYNLYGCAYLDCAAVKFRLPIPAAEETDTVLYKWHDGTIPPETTDTDTGLCRQSHCALEIDVCVHDISNRHSVHERHLHNDFSETKNPPEYKQKLVPSMENLWRDESKRRRARMGITDPDSSPFPPEVLVSVSAEARGDSGQWIHEAEFRTIMMAAAEKEAQENTGSEVTYDNFVKLDKFVEALPSAFQSIEDLYPSNVEALQTSFRQATEDQTLLANHLRSVDVNEDRVLAITEGLDPDAATKQSKSETTALEGPRLDHVDKAATTNGLERRIKDDETSRDKDHYGDGFQDPLDQPIPPEPLKRKTAAELTAEGVREPHDLAHEDEDAFDIPYEYTRKPKKALVQQGPVTGAIELRNSAKRRKVSSTGKSRLDAFHVHEDVDIDTANTPPAEGHAHASQQNSLPASQRSINSQFKVVKDPFARQSQSQTRKAEKSLSPVKTTLRISTQANDAASSVMSKTSACTESPKLTKSQAKAAAQPSFGWAERYLEGFDVKVNCINVAPPTLDEVKKELLSLSRANVIWQEPYYSIEEDVPARKFQYAGKEFTVGSNTTPYFPEFDAQNWLLASADDQPIAIPDPAEEEKAFRREQNICTLKTWEIAALPPSRAAVEAWLEEEQKRPDRPKSRLQEPDAGFPSQVDSASQKNKHGFQYSQKQEATSVKHETQYMSVMSLEIHVNTRGNFVPNPEQDPVCAIFWSLDGDSDASRDKSGKKKARLGALVLSETAGLARELSQMTSIEVFEEPDELDLFNHMVDVVRFHDPDVLAGFEVHGGSWGYLIERARHKYDCNLCDDFSRTKSDAHGRFGRESDRWGFNQTSTIRVTGRHMINIWRAMRVELNLLQYTLENIVFHLLQRRLPHYAFADLTKWWQSSDPADKAKVLSYFVTRVRIDLEILDKNELVPRTSEQARLLGVDFFSVFSRGSQFKVESLMFRIAKPENFILVSPSRQQVGQQNALECLPLVMEPQSAFYNSPLLVLDFQSLYPSIMIAYNYCYSTFLGRINNWRGADKMGFADYKRQARLLELLKDHVNIAPNGMMYVKPHIRKSLLAKMLGEILETRVMVKSGMKVDKEDKTLQRLLHNRQLALKFIANVTYGYTSASFSGRMPCSEIADSIVQTGRETLEKAIALIHSVERWGGEVVYGDTDSLFVYLKGKSKSQAFDIGEEIAEAITEINPKPIKLKFEKVYHPCVLLAKKRYVGFKHESRKQKEPDFDAKGIETVRRDGTPAEQKIEETALKILFRTQDLSQVKSYFQTQCSKIMRGRVSIQDFCFAREVKLGTYSDKGPPPPGALISTRKMLVDPRAEPQYGERVPYLVITGAPGARLIDRCVAPEVLLQNEHLDLDADYYISKNLIPPLERIFNLVGANVRQWYDEMPKIQRIRRIENALADTLDESSGGAASDSGHAGGVGRGKKTMESYMKSSACIVCRENKVDAATGPVCRRCVEKPHLAVLTLRTRVNEAEHKALSLEKVCRSCAGLRFGEEVRCDSKDCPVFYARTRHMAGLRGARAVTGSVMRRLEDIERKDIEW